MVVGTVSEISGAAPPWGVTVYPEGGGGGGGGAAVEVVIASGGDGDGVVQPFAGHDVADVIAGAGGAGVGRRFQIDGGVGVAIGLGVAGVGRVGVVVSNGLAAFVEVFKF